METDDGKAVQGQDGDKTLTCRDCQRTFSFTVGEQGFYKEKGYTNAPRRCKNCKAGARTGTHSKVARDQETKDNATNSRGLLDISKQRADRVDGVALSRL